MSDRPGLIVFEDDHLLVVNKPAGWNTHAPAPFAGEGVYEWLKHREPRWAALAILHRLDRETSGLMVFGKTTRANQSLTAQFGGREVRKTYILRSAGRFMAKTLTAVSHLVRVGDHYVSRPSGAASDRAETNFRLRAKTGGLVEVEAQPLTGRTHQIRVHAADHGFPVLGDTRYGGASSRRLCLHAERLAFRHPAEDRAMDFFQPADFDADPRFALRQAIVDAAQTDAFRLLHSAADGEPGCYVERLGFWLLVSDDDETAGAAAVAQFSPPDAAIQSRGIYRRRLSRQVRRSSVEASSPEHVGGDPAPERFVVRENGMTFELSFREGYSVGLFLDQRDNRRRLLTGHVAAGFPLPSASSQPTNPDSPLAGTEVLNCFAYTCAFSVCAARAGARVTSLDLARKYLEWGHRNFLLNNLDPTGHDFIYGDCFDWLRRLVKKGRTFDTVLLDPPTFSQSKEHGVFRAENDYGDLVRAALPVVKPGGVLFASTNAARFAPEEFVAAVRSAVLATERQIVGEHYVPQPPDFPVCRSEPAYLKTLWLRVA